MTRLNFSCARPGAHVPQQRARSRFILLALCCAGFGGRLARAETMPPGAPGPTATAIQFTARVPGSGGQVVCALFRENGWLKKPVSTAKSPLRNHESSCLFVGVETGTYAIVAFHDENGNGRLDTNFLGIPSESWCTSRNAKALFGPPSFSGAKFLTRAGVIRLSGSM